MTNLCCQGMVLPLALQFSEVNFVYFYVFIGIKIDCKDFAGKFFEWKRKRFLERIY